MDEKEAKEMFSSLSDEEKQILSDAMSLIKTIEELRTENNIHIVSMIQMSGSIFINSVTKMYKSGDVDGATTSIVELIKTLAPITEQYGNGLISLNTMTTEIREDDQGGVMFG